LVGFWLVDENRNFDISMCRDARSCVSTINTIVIIEISMILLRLRS